MRGKRENFFSREKKFSLSPRAPHTLSRKAKNFFNYVLPIHVGEHSQCKKQQHPKKTLDKAVNSEYIK